MNKMKIIGVDLDDVLLNFNDAFLAFHNSKYGTSVKREHIVSYNLDEVWGVSLDVILERLQHFYLSDDHKNATPLTGAVDALTKLAENNVLHIVTASPEVIKEEIKVWLGKHFSDIFKDVHFTRRGFFDMNWKNKADVCKELGIEVFVEDSISNATNIAAIGIPVFLIDTPWNQGETGPLITRVKSWEEISI